MGLSYDELREIYWNRIENGEINLDLEFNVSGAIHRLEAGGFTRNEFDPNGRLEGKTTSIRQLTDQFCEGYRPFKEFAESWFNRRGHALPEVFVGIYSDSDLNVEVRPNFGEGANVYYNVTLQFFFYQTAKVISNFRPEKMEQSSFELFSIMDATLAGDPRYAPPTEVAYDDATKRVYEMVDGKNLFVIAHEIAHLTEPSDISKEEAEIRADDIAIDILLEYAKSAEMNPIVVLGPVLFFESFFFYRVWQNLMKEEGDVVKYDCHPPDLDRRDKLMKRIIDSDVDRMELEIWYTSLNYLLAVRYDGLFREFNPNSPYSIEEKTISFDGKTSPFPEGIKFAWS